MQISCRMASPAREGGHWRGGLGEGGEGGLGDAPPPAGGIGARSVAQLLEGGFGERELGVLGVHPRQVHHLA